MNTRPRKPRFLSEIRNIVKPGGHANGVTDFGDIRLLKRSIYAIGNGRRLDGGRVPGLTDFLDM
jgi:hypothetical protein